MSNRTLIISSMLGVLMIMVLIVIYNLPTIGGSFGYGMPGPVKEDTDDRVVITNAPPQVIYRLDDHRFLTFENYIACDKSGQVYYNDTKLGIKTRLEIFNRDLLDDDGNVEVKSYYAGDDQIQLKNVKNGIIAYKGILINNASNGALAFPYLNNRWLGCNNNYGCYQGALVSTDLGRTFYPRNYERSFSRPNIETIMIVEDDQYIIGSKYSSYLKKVPFDYQKKISEEYDENFKTCKYEASYQCDNTIKPSKVRFVKRE